MVNARVTCSKLCANKYRIKVGKERKHTWGDKISKKLKGRKCPWNQTDEARRNHSLGAKKGKDSHLWTGANKHENTIARDSVEYKIWRDSVYMRDNYTCQICGKGGGKLNADHIKPFAYFKELRFNLENGRTLCVECHKKTDTYLGKARKHKLVYGINISEV